LAATLDEESPYTELDALYRQMFSAVTTVNVKDILEIIFFFWWTPNTLKNPHVPGGPLSDFLPIILSNPQYAVVLLEEDDGPIRLLVPLSELGINPRVPARSIRIQPRGYLDWLSKYIPLSKIGWRLDDIQQFLMWFVYKACHLFLLESFSIINHSDASRLFE